MIILILVVIIVLLAIVINKKENFQNPPPTKKIAFCFLIYDKINHEELWNNFLKNVDKNKYNIYIHYKTNKPLKYFEQYKLKNTVETKWCGESLVKAQNLLLEEAVKDKNNTEIQAGISKQHTRIYCPFHYDSTPSAFIDYSTKSGNHYIRCSSCNQTF